MAKVLKAYFYNLLLSLNQVLNAVLGGIHNETISLRSAKSWRDGEPLGCIFCKVLDFFSADHCRIVGWRNGVPDMPGKENLHLKDLVPTSREETIEFIVAFFGGATLATFIWWITS